MNATQNIINITAHSGDILQQALTNSIQATFITSFEPILYLFFGLAILAAGHYVRNWALVISSGVWFLGLSATSLLGITQLGFSLVLFFALVGILLVIHGISNFYDQDEPTTIKLNDERL